MKLLWILVLLTTNFLPISTKLVVADQISYQEGARISDTDNYYVSNDRRLQYNYGDEKYAFAQIRRIGVHPSYAGFNYDLGGVGFGRNIKFDKFSMFAQAGYYIIKNSVGHTAYDEGLDYYFTSNFGGHPDFKSYEIKNDDAFALTIGMDIPFSENFGFKLSYQHLKFKEVIIGHKVDPPEGLQLWWVPKQTNLSSIGAGLYYNF